MAKEYLDKAGLTYFWGKIKDYVDSHTGGGVTIDAIYPVGSIYMSVSSTNPNTLFPGTTWQEINGRFLVAQGNNGASGYEALNLSAGATGGQKDVKLTAGQSGVQSHTHGHTLAVSPTAHKLRLASVALGSGGTSRNIPNSGSGTSNATFTDNHSLTGSISNATEKDATSAHENLPPYLAVYMWKRTA